MSAIIDASKEYEIRPMRDGDLDAIIEIEHDSYPFPWSKKIFSDCLRVGYSCWVIDYQAQGIGGYGILSCGAGEAHILNLCIASGFRGQGVGARLLSRLIDLARWHAAATIFLEVRPSNEAAIHLYERSGFSIVGRRPNYYPSGSGREDALIMALQLSFTEFDQEQMKRSPQD